MKITFQNFGIITEAEIEPKPLTIFTGPNNTGKTWVAYALAGILGPYGFLHYAEAYVRGEVSTTYDPLDSLVDQVIKTGAATIDIVQFATDYAEIYFNDVSHCIQDWISDFLSTDLASFENLNVSVELSDTLADILDKIFRTNQSSQIIGPKEGSKLTIRKPFRNRELSVYTTSQGISSEDASIEEQFTQPLPPDVIKEFLITSIFRLIQRSVYREVYVLPTERTAFIAHPYKVYKKEITEISTDQNSIVQDETLHETKVKSIPAPLSFFLSLIRTTSQNEASEKKQREKDAKNNPKIRQYVQLSLLLQEQILGGEVKYAQSQSINSQKTSPQDEFHSTDVLFQPTKDSQLEISIASSMVKELSPLVFYLRYQAKPGDLIVIDEPEMNLHPEAQVKIIEFLAILVNTGLNVLITTHSPYVVDHLTNLIKAYEVEDKENVRNEFYLKQAEAFISKDKVSVYLFGEGKAIKAIDEEGVIELNTFGQVSDRISEIYFNL